jgi:hypothetical protein
MKTIKKANVAAEPAKKEESVTKKARVQYTRLGRNDN